MEEHDSRRLVRDIFCKGGDKSILHLVQMNEIFPDSKTFVDLKIRTDPGVVLQEFQDLLQHDSTPTKQTLSDFVLKHMSGSSSLSAYRPPDWSDMPFNQIQDGQLRELATELNRRWEMLGRRTIEEKELSTLLNLPNPAIVPGGRFREIYYWDTYWVLRGLYVSKMFSTARGIIENLVHLLGELGYVPNGGRAYYTRSQPPLLALMVWDYYKQTGDKDWVVAQVEPLEQEWNYWQQNHYVKVKGRNVFRYNCEEGSPRPESYREDFNLALDLDEDKKLDLYRELRSGAESGWDYSSRWFDDASDPSSSLADLRVRSIIPVDLNSFLAVLPRVIADIHTINNRTDQAEVWYGLSEEAVEGLEELCWNEEEGTWFDYDTKTNKQRKFYSASNLTPLWTKTCPVKDLKYRGRRSVEYLERTGVLKFPGGIPATLVNSGEQWDFPNVWPPLEHIIISGLSGSGDEGAGRLAQELAKKTVKRNLKVYQKTGNIYEKYDCVSGLKAGLGGEYSVQLGFGWTNGVTLDLIDMFQQTSAARDGIVETTSR